MDMTFYENLHTVIVAGCALVDDKTASIAPKLYGGMNYDGSLIEHGTRINWGGKLKRAAVDLWDREENNPDNAPTLWEDIHYREGIRIIPEVITATLKFSEGELGWWGEEIYKSLVDSNVYTPAQYAPNWEIYERN